jgi:hypothetical protein
MCLKGGYCKDWKQKVQHLVQDIVNVLQELSSWQAGKHQMLETNSTSKLGTLKI